MTATLFDEVLKYGLFLGGIFQLICIFAIIFVPSKSLNNIEACGSEDSPQRSELQGKPARHPSKGGDGKARKRR